MSRTFLVYRGFDRGPSALLMRASNLAAACAAAKRQVRPDQPTVTVRDVLGGLRAEFVCRNERQGEFGREWDVVSMVTK